MLARRMLTFAAILFTVTLLAAAFTPPPPRSSSAPAPAAPPSASASTSDTVSRTIDADAAREKPVRITLREGDLLHLEVSGELLDGVALEGLGAIRPLGQGAVAIFDVLPQAAGTYPVTLVSGARIGTIDVVPPPREGLAPVDAATERSRAS